MTKIIAAFLVLVYIFIGTTIDTLFHFNTEQEGMVVPPAPKGKHIFGTVTINDRDQIVIPKSARDIFNINPGDRLILLGDENQGLALTKAEFFEAQMKRILGSEAEQTR